MQAFDVGCSPGLCFAHGVLCDLPCFAGAGREKGTEGMTFQLLWLLSDAVTGRGLLGRPRRVGLPLRMARAKCAEPLTTTWSAWAACGWRARAWASRPRQTAGS